MSSDSEDDCYGNIAQKLQSVKSKYEEDKIKTTDLLDDSLKTDSTSKKADTVIEIDDNSYRKHSKVSKEDSDCEEISLDAIIAKHTKRRQTRSSKQNADISADNILPGRGRKRTRGSNKKSDDAESVTNNLNTTNESASASSVNIPVTVGTSLPSSVDTPNSATTPRGRGRGGKRARRSRNTGNNTARNINTTINTNTASSNVNATTTTSDVNTSVNSSLNSSNSSNELDFSSILSIISSGRRGRGRRRQRTPRRRRMWLPDFFPMFNLGAPSRRQIQTSYPTYNIGNTDEYPDECYNQPLFNSTAQSKKKEDVIIVGENEPEDLIDENEELSVKVYWQSFEVVKFSIRRFQKFTQIFDFFANRENVSHDKLFFTYNDKILKIDDTPDSITYNIVKFIDGGIINQSVSGIIQNNRTVKDTLREGCIELKFQCQNVKRPFNTSIRPEDKMSVAFMMCAEHFEKPLDKLKFHFDGDLITGKHTPRDLELEGGECIDVTIVS